MSDSGTCNQCGSVLPANGGSCLRCLLAVGLQAGDSKPLGPGFLDDLPVTGKDLLIANKYRVLETIGRGGMGVVYKARQENLDRVVAVKMVLMGAHAGEEEKARFLREAQTAARLQHPGIVAVHDWGDDDGVLFYSMEYVAGRDLAAEVKERGPLDPKRAAALVKSVAEAVAYAHGQQVLHRDLKPQNLLLTAQGVVKITDFGLAKVMDGSLGLTATGQVLGSMGYLSPEQASGGEDKVGTWSDVYGMGSVLYHLLTGRPPFVGRETAEVLRQSIEEDPVGVRRLKASVPMDLETICLKCLEKESARRYGSAQELVDELDRFLRNEPILARPPTLADRLGKWLHRNPTLAYAALLVSIVGIVGACSTLLYKNRSEQRHIQLTETALRQVIQRAQSSYEQGDAYEAARLLGEQLREHPDQRVVAECLINLLNQKSFLVPAGPGFGQGVCEANYCAQGCHIVTLNANQHGYSVELWTREGQRILELPYESKRILCASLSPDARYIVVGTVDGCQVWEASTGHFIKNLVQTNGSVFQLEFRAVSNQAAQNGNAGSSDSKSLRGASLSGSTNTAPLLLVACRKSLLLFDADSLRKLGEFRCSDGGIQSATLSADGALLAAASTESRLQVWHAQTGRVIFESRERAHTKVIRSIAFNSSDSQLLTGSADKDAKLWSLNSEFDPVKFPHDGSVNHSVFGGSDTRCILTACADNTLSIWDPSAAGYRQHFLEHPDAVDFVTYNAKSHLILTTCADNRMRLWSFTDGRFIAQSSDQYILRPLSRPDFSNDGQSLLAVLRQGTSAQLRRIGGGGWSEGAGIGLSKSRCTAASKDLLLACQRKYGKLHKGEIVSCDISQDGRKVATGSRNGSVVIAETKSGRLLSETLNHAGAVSQVRFSPDGLRIVTSTPVAGDMAKFRIWDSQTGLPLTDWWMLNDALADIVFNEKGDRVLTSSGMQVEVAVVNGDVPSWLPEIALRITGDSGQSPDEHAAAYLHFRKHILDDAFNDAWIGWARNLLR